MQTLGDGERVKQHPGLSLIAATLCGAVLLLKLVGGVATFQSDPPLWVGTIALGAIAAQRGRLPLVLAVFWFYGLASLTWSLGPGNTMIAFVWEGALIASFIVGTVPLLAGALLGVVVVDGFLDVAALSMAGLQQYLSGSVNYVGGAIGAAAVVPMLYLATEPTRSHLTRAVGFVLGIMALSLALASGSRAVYMAILLATVLMVIQLLRQTFKAGRRFVVLVALAMSVSSAGLVALLPNAPDSVTLSDRTGVTSVVDAVGEYGVLTQRLRLWQQALDTVLAYPFGTGDGTYRATAHAFQKYPMLWSSSPHNFFMETLATGGWPRFVILLLLLTTCLVRGFRGCGWQWSVAAMTLGFTTLFDVTASYPKVMAVEFMLLGAAFYSHRGTGELGSSTWVWEARAQRALKFISVASLLFVSVWWFWPCRSTVCATERFLGVDYKTLPALTMATPPDRETLLTKARRLYPQSLWVLQAELIYSSTLAEKLVVAGEIATRYPLHSPFNYVTLAELELESGHLEQARAAIERGLEVFPRGFYPYGEMRVTPEAYDSWLARAEEILALVDGPQPNSSQ